MNSAGEMQRRIVRRRLIGCGIGLLTVIAAAALWQFYLPRGGLIEDNAVFRFVAERGTVLCAGVAGIALLFSLARMVAALRNDRHLQRYITACTDERRLTMKHRAGSTAFLICAAMLVVAGAAAANRFPELSVLLLLLACIDGAVYGLCLAITAWKL